MSAGATPVAAAREPWRARTLVTKKIWGDLSYTDLNIVLEHSSQRPLDSLRARCCQDRRLDRTSATADHHLPTDGTTDARLIADELPGGEAQALECNCAKFREPLHSAAAGFSPWVGMNTEVLDARRSYVSTSNRNIEGPQRPGCWRTKAMSRAMAACASVCEHFVDVHGWQPR